MASPLGVSALPVEIREKVPAELRYWEAKSVEEGLALRAKLRAAMQAGEVQFEAGEAEKRLTPFSVFGRFPDTLVADIIKHLPEHKVYAECFTGPAQFIHNKDQRAETEIIGDIDKQIVRLHKTIQRLDEHDFKRLEKMRGES